LNNKKIGKIAPDSKKCCARNKSQKKQYIDKQEIRANAHGTHKSL